MWQWYEGPTSNYILSSRIHGHNAIHVIAQKSNFVYLRNSFERRHCALLLMTLCHMGRRAIAVQIIERNCDTRSHSSHRVAADGLGWGWIYNLIYFRLKLWGIHYSFKMFVVFQTFATLCGAIVEAGRWLPMGSGVSIRSITTIRAQN